ncbi:MAG: RdgB/HAM1 family non-canonical purine NTP pyrophosphatase [Anaerolineae bacterium]|nr:RdgB/HAM1 family non-canonical purine NTP pyrophosphatase [Anaerolineae bacterium]
MNLLVATNNPGKRAEFRQLLAELAHRLVFPADLGLALDVAETGGTYTENAVLKAHAFAAAARQRPATLPLLVLADDSGLEVDALDGAPGLHSARYTPGSDADRHTTLLRHLQGVPPAERTARFRCIIAIVTPADDLYTVEGICEGVIAATPAGDGGFGYDPVFFVPEYGLTMAQLPADVKNHISHRARAAQAALPILRRLLLD